MKRSNLPPLAVMPSLIFADSRLTKTDLRVLGALCARRNRKTGLCCPSQERISSDLGIAERHVRTALKHLEACGQIIRNQKRRADGTLGVCRYTIVNLEGAQGNDVSKDRNGNPADETCPVGPDKTCPPVPGQNLSGKHRTLKQRKDNTHSKEHNGASSDAPMIFYDEEKEEKKLKVQTLIGDLGKSMNAGHRVKAAPVSSHFISEADGLGVDLRIAWNDLDRIQEISDTARLFSCQCRDSGEKAAAKKAVAVAIMADRRIEELESKVA